jgi:hypothetical protein
MRQFGDEFVGTCELGDCDHLGARHGGVGKRDIVMDRAIEQDVLLQDDADIAAKPGWIYL